MKKKHGVFYLAVILSALVIVCCVTIFYTGQMNRTISDNIIRSISEMAEHDKVTIQTYIEICWEDLHEIGDRFAYAPCNTIEEVLERIDLECSTGSFDHIYLVADDGTVYTEGYAAYTPDDGVSDSTRALRFLSYFSEDRSRVVKRYDGRIAAGGPVEESILYAIRLDGCEAGGAGIAALIGINDIDSIKDNMVIDSFIRDGKSRGHSALIDRNGNYIVNINKQIYLNEQDNLYVHLEEAQDAELTNEEVAARLANSETFGFYHSHEEEEYRELFYFIPFAEMDLYFIMSLNEEVFMEQNRTFAALSIGMLTLSMVTVSALLVVIVIYQNKTIRIAEKARSQKVFLSNMSHEIRTPLNGLIGMNHLIMVHIDNEEQRFQIKEWLRKSHSTANYLLSLVNDILDMSKLQEGKVDLLCEPLSVEALIDEIYAMQADNIKSRGVEFIVERDIPEPYIEGDEVRIKQVLMNIVGNAAKFTPGGGRITLSVSQEKTDEAHVITTIRCQDTGIGMSKEYLGKIFDSFSQEKNRTTNKIKGTGLGMAISKLLTDAMGGSIVVESELNVGSTFTITLPAAIVTEIPDYLKAVVEPAAFAESTGLVKQDEKVKILVAEDVELNAEILLEILALEGFETAHAWDGREALKMFEESGTGEFRIILMDMEMPVMGGCEAAKAIRKLDRADAGSVLIYACTANTFQEDRDMALESGMDDFLTKPIDVKVLIKKMALALQQEQ